jgi:hypothetical protein
MTTIMEDENEDMLEVLPPPPPPPQIDNEIPSLSLAGTFADQLDPLGLTSEGLLMLACPLHPGVSDCLCQDGFIAQWDPSSAPQDATVDPVAEPDYNQIQNVGSPRSRRHLVDIITFLVPDICALISGSRNMSGPIGHVTNAAHINYNAIHREDSPSAHPASSSPKIAVLPSPTHSISKVRPQTRPPALSARSMKMLLSGKTHASLLRWMPSKICRARTLRHPSLRL